MFRVVLNDTEVSRHRILRMAGRAAVERMGARVVDAEGRDITYSAKDAWTKNTR